MVNDHPEAASYTAVPGAGSSDCRVLATMIALLLPGAKEKRKEERGKGET